MKNLNKLSVNTENEEELTIEIPSFDFSLAINAYQNTIHYAEKAYEVSNDIIQNLESTYNIFQKLVEYAEENRNKNSKANLILTKYEKEFKLISDFCWSTPTFLEEENLISILEEIKNIDSENVEMTLKEKMFKKYNNHYLFICEEILERIDEEWSKRLFEETIQAYSYNLLETAVNNQIILIEYFLNKLNNDKSNIRYMKLIISLNNSVNEMNFIDNYNNHISMNMVKKILPILFHKSDFNNPEEPNQINRHWRVHGRTNKAVERSDFLKMLFLLDNVSLLAFNYERHYKELLESTEEDEFK